ncbi:DUF4911 domain-containing protein [Hydrogenivirga sp. 128-5-R1-1]|uniref:DUF4911 domain-containing protein n=1 Tax=Hydrogenivirga sp. 128-5-R1-1 TaxID=392423 RepID=UPI00015F18E4|nr:DUF4911 domain-containing protein [Hydrogenivirga sp. 128-5-R1-1]EDP75426.1 hypothetical protein HG1285_15716 [Hydrogenivirga sp. 128-5-R1-1]
MSERRSEIKARILTVRLPISEVGFLNSLVDGLDRVALTRTRRKGEGIVDIIASPDRFDELLDIVEGFKKHVKGLEVVGESRFEELNF